MMGLFSFFTEDGKGCSAVLNRSALVYEVIVIFYHTLNQIKFFKSLVIIYWICTFYFLLQGFVPLINWCIDSILASLPINYQKSSS
jgi:hypothetical protein